MDRSVWGERHLPEEVIHTILAWLPIRSFCRLRSVCKKWHDAVKNPSLRSICRQIPSKLPFWIAFACEGPLVFDSTSNTWHVASSFLSYKHSKHSFTRAAILDAAGSLLFYRSFDSRGGGGLMFVFNPMSKHRRRIPIPAMIQTETETEAELKEEEENYLCNRWIFMGMVFDAATGSYKVFAVDQIFRGRREGDIILRLQLYDSIQKRWEMSGSLLREGGRRVGDGEGEGDGDGEEEGDQQAVHEVQGAAMCNGSFYCLTETEEEVRRDGGDESDDDDVDDVDEEVEDDYDEERLRGWRGRERLQGRGRRGRETPLGVARRMARIARRIARRRRRKRYHVYKVGSVAWEEVKAELPAGLSFPRLFENRGRLLLGGGVVVWLGLLSVHLWQLDEAGLEWVEVLRMPDELVDELVATTTTGYPDPMVFVANGDFIGVASGCQRRILRYMCDLTRGVWWSLPSEYEHIPLHYLEGVTSSGTLLFDPRMDVVFDDNAHHHRGRPSSSSSSHIGAAAGMPSCSSTATTSSSSSCTNSSAYTSDSYVTCI